MKQRKCMPVLVALSLQALSAHAGNLVLNSDFDAAQQISGWGSSHTGTGSVTWSATDGSPAAGSLELSAPSPSDTARATYCITPIASQAVDFILRSVVLASSGTGNGSDMQFAAFDTAGCSGTKLGTFFTSTFDAPIPGIPPNWAEFFGQNITLPPATASVEIELDVSAGASAGSSNTVLFDDIRFGPTGTTPVRLQSFDVQ